MIIDWNFQAEQIFGWSRQEAIGRLLSTTIIPAQHREAHEQGLRHFLATGKGPMLNTRVEITGVHRDGHEIPIELAISPALGQGGHTRSARSCGISRRGSRRSSRAACTKRNCNDSTRPWIGVCRPEHKSWPPSTNHWSLKWLNGCRPRRRSNSSRQALQKLAFQLLRVQEEERRRISRDLHDDINQRLALLAMDIEAVGRQLGFQPDQVGQAVRAIQDRVVELSDVVRHLAYQLHPSILDDLGLPIALQRLVDDFTARSNIRGSFGHKNIPASRSAGDRDLFLSRHPRKPQQRRSPCRGVSSRGGADWFSI